MAMQKYITRTFEVLTGKKMIPDYSTMTFQEQEVTLIDPEEVPLDIVSREVNTVKARMPIETFFANAEKIIVK